MDKLLGSGIAGGNTAYQRNAQDRYPTPPDVTVALMDFLKIPKYQRIWEPACGDGYMVNAMRGMGYDVIGTDIQSGTDFLEADVPAGGVSWIITNPPFSLSEQFIEKCIQHERPFALLLKSQYWHAKRRLPLFREHAPSYILPLSWRPDFLFKERGSGSPLMDVMWCVWLMGPPMRYPVYIVLDRPEDEGRTKEG